VYWSSATVPWSWSSALVVGSPPDPGYVVTSLPRPSQLGGLTRLRVGAGMPVAVTCPAVKWPLPSEVAYMQLADVMAGAWVVTVKVTDADPSPVLLPEVSE
jgi:hypothetical protein